MFWLVYNSKIIAVDRRFIRFDSDNNPYTYVEVEPGITDLIPVVRSELDAIQAFLFQSSQTIKEHQQIIDELQDIREKYNQKLKELQNN